MRLRSTRHVKYWCGYHFVWIPKYRRDVLVGEIAEYTKGVLSSILKELGCEPIALEVMPDHVHVFTLCPPRHAPSYIARYLKGKSSRKILQKFPGIKAKTKSGKLWSRSYFVATVGNVTAEVVKKYVEEK
ncbi:IS200/IS605 family transposase [Acidianus sp. RZ1]|uniref:IS200/IS605 family transposase n=1 Tax=Acidianus sp. RZ1 TaxID=1540082 RepID=UPI0014931C08|nr:IS200/IS605 family transposase [Acidianus sp. RZ1]